ASPGKSISVFLSKSKPFKYSRNFSEPSFSQPSIAAATLDERANPSLKLMDPHPSPPLSSRIAGILSFIEYFPDLNASSPWYTPSSIAAAQVNIFIVDPGSIGAEIASLYQFFTSVGLFGL